MKEIFLITAYCDTEEKTSVLKNSILELKKLDCEICIVSHSPLDTEIQKMVNYYIYDKSNPIIDDGSKVITRWRWYVTGDRLLNFDTSDYSFAVINLWKNGLTFLKAIGYEKIFIVNYDNYINDNSFFRKCSDSLDENDISFLYCSTTNMNYNFLNLMITFLPIKYTIIDDFLQQLNFDKYKNYQNAMLEQFISLDVIPNLENKYKIASVQEAEYINFMPCGTVEARDQFESFVKYDNDDSTQWYNIFCGKNIDSGFVEILVYEISKPIERIEIIIQNREYHAISNVSNKYQLITTSINNSEFNDIIKLNQLQIKINNEPVFEDKLNIFSICNSHLVYKK